MGSSNRRSNRPRRIPEPGEAADSRLITWYLTEKCGLTAQNLGQLIGCSPPTIYRVMNGKDPHDSVAQHLKSLWQLLGGSSAFGDAIAASTVDDRIRVVQRMARLSPAERIWETGLREAATLQLQQIDAAAGA